MDHTVEGGVHQPNVLIPDGAQPELDRPTKIRKIDQYCQPECPCCNMSKRYTQAWMVAIGFIISFGIRFIQIFKKSLQKFDEWWFVSPYFISLNYRCNVGVSVVKMQGIPEFQWSPETIGFVDASFFWGYIVTQIPGGFLAARYLLF